MSKYINFLQSSISDMSVLTVYISILTQNMKNMTKQYWEAVKPNLSFLHKWITTTKCPTLFCWFFPIFLKISNIFEKWNFFNSLVTENEQKTTNERVQQRHQNRLNMLAFVLTENDISNPSEEQIKSLFGFCFPFLDFWLRI